MKNARPILRKKVNDDLRRLRRRKLTNKGWSETLAKRCQDRCDLQLFLENGGLDKNYKLQAEKRLEDIDLASVREKRAEIDGLYINSLVQRIQNGALDLGNPEDFKERVMALLSDAIEQFSEWHGPEILDSDTEHRLNYRLEQDD